MGRGRKIIGGLGLLMLLGIFIAIGSGQIEPGEGITLLIILVLFVMPGLINLTR